MKISRNMLVLLCVCTVLGVGVGVSSYYIYSGITAPVQVGGYALSMTSSYDSSTMTLTGTLTSNGAGLVGKTIDIYTNASNTEGSPLSTHIAAVTTTTGGAFSYTYQPINGTYRYQARYEVT